MLEKPNLGTRLRVDRRTLAMLSLASVLCLAPFSLVRGRTLDMPHIDPLLSIVPLRQTASKPGRKVVAKHVPGARRTATGLTIRVFRLKYAKAEKTAAILRQVLAFGAGNKGRVAPEPATNAIVVSGSPALVAQIADVIRNLDQAETPPTPAPTEHRSLNVFPLKSANSDEVARIISKLYGGTDSVKAVSDSRTNAVIVTAAESIVPEVRQTIIHLDTPIAPVPVNMDKEMVTKVYMLKYSDATQVVSTLKASYGGEPGWVVADKSTNSLIVHATGGRCKEITRLLTQLDISKK